jgi:hypothetical protein
MDAALHPLGFVKVRTEGRPRPLTIHRYLPFAILYFFLNSVGLPTGLFFTTILSPLLYVGLYCKGKRWITFWFLLCLSPFVLAHFSQGVYSPYFYARSTALLWTAYVTVFALFGALLHDADLERLFDELILVNFVVCLIAIPLIVTPARKVVWDNVGGVEGAGHFYRLKLLTSEPSAYSSLMVPLVIFATLRLMRMPNKRHLIYLLMIAFPFLICQSFGGISGVSIGIGVATLVSFRHLLPGRKSLILLGTLASFLALLLLTPNPVSRRLLQVVTGQDSSAHSRTIFSFIVAYTVAGSKSLLWGAGLGQGKTIDVSDLGLGFDVGIIPNAVAGTFAELGIVGMVVRFAAEGILFFKTRVYANPFRLAIFIATFGFQLSGSYLDNVQEGLMWCFAFGPFFPEMDRKQIEEL